MARRRNGNRNRGRSKKLQTVVIAPSANPLAARLERQIAAMVQSKSITRVLFKRVDTLDALATGSNLGAFSFANLYGDSDWATYTAQYLTFRVSGIKFEVYDTQPNVPAFALFGTYSVAPANTGPVSTSITNVTDSPDAAQVPPGEGLRCFYWNAEGTLENNFNATSQTALDLGGLRYDVVSSGGGGATAGKYRIISTYVVDFRSRT
jgi:hypothetical protein